MADARGRWSAADALPRVSPHRRTAHRRRFLRAWRRLVLVGALAGSALRAAPAGAHALDPVLFELRERPDGKIDVTWKAPNARVLGLDLVPLLPSKCARLGDVASDVEGDATVSRWVVDCGGSIVGCTVGVTGLESTDALLRVTLRSGAVDRRVLGADHPAVRIVAAPTRLDVFSDYARLGVEHIANGIDHLLFVFGLLLLTGGTRLLLATITAFTLGHSVTLALAALQVVSVSQAPVEVVIAVTIWVLAVELSRDMTSERVIKCSWPVRPRLPMRKSEPTASVPPHPRRPPAAGSTLLRRWPWAMAFCFGLLHGLGFAGALRETGLPAHDVPLALLSFNVGIEAGQVAFVVTILVASVALRRLHGARPPWVQRIPVYAMGTASTYWILARAAVLF
jgi:hypothetical protein